MTGAFNQLQTYKAADRLALSHQRRAGLLGRHHGAHRFADRRRERFMPWRTITGEDLRAEGAPELETLLQGRFRPPPLPGLCSSDFIVFGDQGDETVQDHRRLPPVPRRAPASWHAIRPRPRRKATARSA